MKHKHLRHIILFGTFVLTLLMVVQGYWFKKAFDISERQFDHTVQVALKKVADSVVDPSQGKVEVQKLSSNFFFINSESSLQPEEVNQFIQYEFNLRNLDIDYELGIYKADEDTLVYGNYIQSTKARLIEKEISDGRINQPPLQNFAVYFPHKTSYLAAELDIWIFSTIVLILMIIFFAWAIFSLLKEKRYADMKTDFINNLTHEFKTPITNISIASEVLKKKYGHTHEDIIYFNILQKENKILNQKIEHLLSAAANEKPNVTNFQKVNLNEIILECAKTFELRINERGGSLKLDLEPNENTCFGDRELLLQAFTNLIDNAEKYSPEKPLIHIKSQKTKKGLALSITDQGIGIPAKWHQKVFDKFFRFQDGNVHNVNGFGLGLNFVKNVIQSHNGRITLKSDLNQGTEINILLPSF